MPKKSEIEKTLIDVETGFETWRGKFDTLWQMGRVHGSKGLDIKKENKAIESYANKIDDMLDDIYDLIDKWWNHPLNSGRL